MENKSLQQIHIGLLNNLIEELIFFVPYNIVLATELEKIDYFKENNIFNQLFVFDYYLGPIKYKVGRNNSKIFLKAGALEKNIFELLSHKGQLLPFQFDYVQTKYKEQIEGLFHLTDWMANNLTFHINCNDQIIELFKIQQSNYRSHHDTFMENFYPKDNQKEISSTELESSAYRYFKDLKKFIEKKDIPKLSNGPNDSTQSNENSGERSKDSSSIGQVAGIKEPKRPLISDVDAEISILKSVFKVSF